MKKAIFEKADLTSSNFQTASDASDSTTECKAIDKKLGRECSINQRTNLRETFFNEANLTKAFVQYADLYKADFSRADLTETGFYKSSLKQANLADANLTRTDFTGADLSMAKGVTKERLLESGAILCNTIMPDQKKSFNKCTSRDLVGQDMSQSFVFFGNVDFSESNLTGAKLKNFIATNIKFNEGTNLTNADLQGIKQMTTKIKFEVLSNEKIKESTNKICNTTMPNGKVLFINCTDADLSGRNLTKLTQLIKKHNSDGTENKEKIKFHNANLMDVTGIRQEQLEKSDKIILCNTIMPDGNRLSNNCDDADLTKKDLSGQNLSNISFVGADLISADLTNATLTNANFKGAQANNKPLSDDEFKNLIKASKTVCNITLPSGQQYSSSNAQCTGG